MNAVVVYESYFGNTAAIARAIAEGIGEGAHVLTTEEATPEVLVGADLVVAGAPVQVFRLPTDATRAKLAETEAEAPIPPDVSHPSMRQWLEALPPGHARAVAFETRLRWSPGGAIGAIAHAFERAGYRVGEGRKFVVKGTYGPLRDGELERARAWGAELGTAS